jgi:hypothetical protein
MIFIGMLQYNIKQITDGNCTNVLAKVKKAPGGVDRISLKFNVIMRIWERRIALSVETGVLESST